MSNSLGLCTRDDVLRLLDLALHAGPEVAGEALTNLRMAQLRPFEHPTYQPLLERARTCVYVRAAVERIEAGEYAPLAFASVLVTLSKVYGELLKVATDMLARRLPGPIHVHVNEGELPEHLRTPKADEWLCVARLDGREVKIKDARELIVMAAKAQLHDAIEKAQRDGRTAATDRAEREADATLTKYGAY